MNQPFPTGPNPGWPQQAPNPATGGFPAQPRQVWGQFPQAAPAPQFQQPVAAPGTPVQWPVRRSMVADANTGTRIGLGAYKAKFKSSGLYVTLLVGIPLVIAAIVFLGGRRGHGPQTQGGFSSRFGAAGIAFICGVAFVAVVLGIMAAVQRSSLPAKFAREIPPGSTITVDWGRDFIDVLFPVTGPQRLEVEKLVQLRQVDDVLSIVGMFPNVVVPMELAPPEVLADYNWRLEQKSRGLAS